MVPAEAVAETVSKGPEISLAAEKVASFFGFPITNSLVASWMVVASLVVVGLLVRRKVALIPCGLQNGMESILEFILNLGDQVTGNRRETERFFPLVATIFLFIVSKRCASRCPHASFLWYNYIEFGYSKPMFQSAEN